MTERNRASRRSPEKACRPSPSPPTRTACGSTAFSRRAFRACRSRHIQRIIRKGEVRVNGKRAQPKDRLQQGQAVRIPPLKIEPPKPRDERRATTRRPAPSSNPSRSTRTTTCWCSTSRWGSRCRAAPAPPPPRRHAGGAARRAAASGRASCIGSTRTPSGCLLVAKTRFAATALAKTFRTRSARKIYWALVAGVPKPRQGRISTFLAKEEREDESIMRIARHGEEGASHAVTYYAVVETAAQQLAWLSLKPVTGRTHQLRAHMAHIGHPIVGDPKYFRIENWELPGRHAEPAASAGAPHRRAASARRHDRRHRAAAAAHAAVLESARASTPSATTRSSRRRRNRRRRWLRRADVMARGYVGPMLEAYSRVRRMPQAFALCLVAGNRAAHQRPRRASVRRAAESRRLPIIMPVNLACRARRCRTPPQPRADDRTVAAALGNSTCISRGTSTGAAAPHAHATATPARCLQPWR